jgi:type IV pilus assembly protein PilM
VAMFGKKKSIVGLDIGSSCVKAVELAPSGSGWRLERFGLAPLPPEAIVQGSFMNAPAITNAVREAIGRGRIKAKDVATSVSGHAVIVKKIALPAQTPEELNETIRWEAEQYIPFDVNEVNIDHQILGQDSIGGQMDVLLVAAKKDLINDYRTVISDAGLNLVVMDVDAFALGNQYEVNYAPGDGQVVALVDIGAAVINLNVMNGRVPSFTRDVTSGGNQYTEEIQKTLNISFEEAELIKVGGKAGGTSKDVVPQEVEQAMREVSETLMGELLRSLDFYRATTSSAPIEKVLLAGGSARIPGIDRIFQEKIEIPVEVMDPFRRVQVAHGAGDEVQLRELAPSLCVAVGLALRGRNEG